MKHDVNGSQQTYLHDAPGCTIEMSTFLTDAGCLQFGMCVLCGDWDFTGRRVLAAASWLPGIRPRAEWLLSGPSAGSGS
jgi:hypothetical protein